jgi:hypothetical protein
MLAQHAPGQPGATFESFEKAGLASFEHHWNNHVHCGDWCQAKKWTDEEKEEYKNKYRDKVSHVKECEQQKVVLETFCATIRMIGVFHEHNNNKTKQIHAFITNPFLPKISYYSQKSCGRARTFLSVGIDSVGFSAYYQELF